MPARKICEDAIKVFGVDHQLTKAIEECGELITIICQSRDRRMPLEEMASEVADVEIMCEQLRIIIGDNHVDKAKEKKIDRLALRIKYEKQKGAR